MKQIPTILILLLVLLSACRKEDNFMSEGSITGPDYRECACCGGWFIEIGPETYRFQELPEGCIIDLIDAIFPIEVKLDWSFDETPCLGDEIIVGRMELLN